MIVLREAAKALGRVRRTSLDDAEGVGAEESGIALTQQLEQLQALSSTHCPMVAEGRAFYIRATTAVAAVVAKPTTAQMMSIYNDEPEGGRSLIIDWVSAMNVVSTAVASQATIIVNNGLIRVAAPTDSGLIPKKRNGMGSVSNAVVRRQDTKVLSIVTGALNASQGIAHCWIPVASNYKMGVVTPAFYTVHRNFRGEFIVPPGRMFATHVIANVIGETFTMSIGWHEKQLTLG